MGRTGGREGGKEADGGEGREEEGGMGGNRTEPSPLLNTLIQAAQ